MSAAAAVDGRRPKAVRGAEQHGEIDWLTGRASDGAEPNRVLPGATVEVLWEDGIRDTWTISEDGTFDLDAGAISDDSPLARAIVGASVGDRRAYTVNGREWRLRVMRVSPSLRTASDA
jgi:transcription elongation GreA/GreB family factor